jgi:gas vesicle protein
MNDRIYYSREAEQRAEQQRAMLALLVMAFGLGIGAAITLLFAPRSGEKTRKALTSQVEQAVGNGREVTETAFDGLRKEFEHLRSDVEDRLKDMR